MRAAITLALQLTTILVLKSCLVLSDKEHMCICDYGKNADEVITGVECFQDYEDAFACAKACAYRRLMVHFYDDSDSTQKMHDFIKSNTSLKNDMNDNFAIACLPVDDETMLPPDEQYMAKINGDSIRVTTVGQRNREFQLNRFRCSKIPYFVIINPSKDSIVGSFGYLTDKTYIDSIFLNALTK